LESGEFWYEADVNWDQPYENSRASIDICLQDENGKLLTRTMFGATLPACTSPSLIGGKAKARLAMSLSSPKAFLRIRLVHGEAPQRVLIRSDLELGRFATDLGNAYGHVLSPNAVTVGAAGFLETPSCNPSLHAARLESFSSRGGARLIFDNQDRPLPQPYVPQKPDLIAPDGISSIYFGDISSISDRPAIEKTDCLRDEQHWRQFYGTSAAAPHAAAVAALLKQAKPDARWDVIIGAMKNSAEQMEDTHDFRTGNGFIRADRAYLELSK
jgi:subtilisin family serine protease